jgi:phospholipase C
MQKNIVALLALAGAANAGAASLKDIKHVVMLMMENRSFQHVSSYPAQSIREDVPDID